MDNYENEELRRETFEQEEMYEQEVTVEEPEQPVYEPAPQQPVYEPAVERQPYHGVGAGRKESPFADSPYVMYHKQQKAEQPRNANAYVPPVPPQEPPRKPKKANRTSGRKIWKTLLCSALALAILAGSCTVTAHLVSERWEEKTEDMIESFEKRLDDMQNQIDAASFRHDSPAAYPEVNYITAPGAIYQNNVRSVVLISAKVTSSVFGQSTTGVSTGSGFVLTEDGYVVTNHHVIEGASAVTVTMHDGVEYAAKVVGSDSNNDVAVLKIQEEVKLQAVTIGSSTALNVGDQVVAIGNPLGELTSTLTVGYVSAKERNVTTDGTTINMIQTDAAINSGNSGGPLFNSKGEVVGITTAKYSGSSSSGATIEGIGFAIPIDDVMPLVDDLMNYGYINSAYLGVMVSEMDAAQASYYGLPVGAYVQEVTPGSCAEKAGLKAKDIIVGLGELEVENRSDLVKALRKYKAGETTTITVFRSGQELTMEITLDEKPRETTNAQPEDGNYDDWYKYFFGDQG